MDKQSLLDIYTREQRFEVVYPTMRREQAGNVVRHISETGETGFVAWFELDDQSVEQAIDAQMAFFHGRGEGFEWKVYDYDRPADMKARLAARGFSIGEPEALMMMDLQNQPGLLQQPVPPEIMRIVDDAGIDALMALEDTIWHTSHEELAQRLKMEMRREPPASSVYSAVVDSQVVSGAWVNFHHGSSFASLWGGSTLPEYRGRGLYTGLLAVRAQEAHHRGFRFLTVDASPMSRPILEKHGFQCLTYSYPCEWMPG